MLYGDTASAFKHIRSNYDMTFVIVEVILFAYHNNQKLDHMDKVHPNLAVMQQFNPANVEASAEVIAEDAVFHYFNPKLPGLQGDYYGRQGFMEFFGKIAHQSDGTFKVTPLSIVPMGDELVVTHVKDTMTLYGQPLEIDAVVVWRIVDGKIKEAWDIPAVYTAVTADVDSIV